MWKYCWRGFNPPYGKRWRLYILPQYLAFSPQICPCASNILYAKFKVFTKNFWVNVPVAIFFWYGGLNGHTIGFHPQAQKLESP